MSRSTRKLNFRLTPIDLSNIQSVSGLTGLNRSDVVRKSLHLVHALSVYHLKHGSIVLRNDSLKEQEELDLRVSDATLSGTPAEDLESHRPVSEMFQLRLVDGEHDQIKYLTHIGFASNATAIARRSMALARQVLSRLRNDWLCGYFTGGLVFEAIPILDLINLRFVKHAQNNPTVAALLKPLDRLSELRGRPVVDRFTDEVHNLYQRCVDIGEVSPETLHQLRNACVDAGRDILTPPVSGDLTLLIALRAFEEMLLVIRAFDRTNTLVPSSEPGLLLYQAIIRQNEFEQSEMDAQLDRQGVFEEPVILYPVRSK